MKEVLFCYGNWYKERLENFLSGEWQFIASELQENPCAILPSKMKMTEEHIQEVFFLFVLETESKAAGIWLRGCAKRVNRHASFILYYAFNW